jgi:hypothetical protein
MGCAAANPVFVSWIRGSFGQNVKWSFDYLKNLVSQ